MNIEFFYIDDCPNSQNCLMSLQNVLKKLSITEPIIEINIKNKDEALTHKFICSPTIQINGEDIDPSVTPDHYGTSCRMYWNNEFMQGSPSMELIEASVLKNLPKLL